MSKLFEAIAAAFVGPMKLAILLAWKRAQELAAEEIRASLPTEADLAGARATLAEAPEALAAPRAKKKSEAS